MPRPRKPDDPCRRRELPSDRCGGGYYLVVNWGVEDQICGYCYQQAKRTRGTCACGHVGILPGRVHGQPSCRTCAGISLNIDCIACGAEDELYSAGRCWNCTLGDTVDRLLTDSETNSVPEQLVPLATALKSMKRANSGLTWIRQPHVAEFLHNLAIHPEISHQSVDSLPRTRTREYVRGLLVEHDVLSRRDELKIRYQQWADQAMGRVVDQRMRDVIERYIRWHHLCRMNQMDTVPNGTFLRSKQTVTVAINFVNWIHTRGITLEELRQVDIDEWVNGGPSTRLIADRFLGWATTNRHTPAGLTIPRHRRGTSKKLDAASQEAALTKVIDGTVLSPRDRAVASLVLVFGQQIETGRRAHPRVGGEHVPLRTDRRGVPGSSPRGRGTRHSRMRRQVETGLIPAWAGNTLKHLSGTAATPAHPRVGGEHMSTCNECWDEAGSSPRGRGTPHSDHRRRVHPGLIPAWAGNTTLFELRNRPTRAHPRVGGEHDSV